MHLHQVRPLQGYPQVQASRLQPDSTDQGVPDFHAQRHGGFHVASQASLFQPGIKSISEKLRTFAFPKYIV